MTEYNSCLTSKGLCNAIEAEERDGTTTLFQSNSDIERSSLHALMAKADNCPSSRVDLVLRGFVMVETITSFVFTRPNLPPEIFQRWKGMPAFERSRDGLRAFIAALDEQETDSKTRVYRKQLELTDTSMAEIYRQKHSYATYLCKELSRLSSTLIDIVQGAEDFLLLGPIAYSAMRGVSKDATVYERLLRAMHDTSETAYTSGWTLHHV